MINNTILALFIFTLLSTLVPSVAIAGKLDELEAEASKPNKSQTNKSSSSEPYYYSPNSAEDSDDDSTLSGFFAEMLVNITIESIKLGTEVMIAATENSYKRYESRQPNIASDELHLYRLKGDPILPTFSLSSHWLSSSNSISAQQNRFEAGHGFVGLSHTQNTLDEKGHKLTLSNTLIHLRMSAGNDFSWDLAWGKGKMNGNQSHTGNVFAMPIRMRINPAVHLEYFPVWSSYNGGSLSEQQFSVNWRSNKYAGISAGYKKWSAGTSTVEGLFAGLNLSF
jgi:hypothetical protein